MKRTLTTLALVAMLMSAMFFSVATEASAAKQGNGGGQTAGQANFGNLISALNNISAQISNLQALNDISLTDIQVVNIQDSFNNLSALNNSLNRNAVDIGVLQNFLNNNTVTVTDVLNNNNVLTFKDALNNILSQNNLALSDVVAINVLSGGDIIVFA